MILTARDKDCQYIWYAHAARARQEGISDEFVDALRDKKPLPKLPNDEQIVVDYATELFATNRVSPGTFQAALTPDQKGYTRRFWTIGTGHHIPDEFIHIASFQDGPFVWHVYED